MIEQWRMVGVQEGALPLELRLSTCKEANENGFAMQFFIVPLEKVIKVIIVK
jgi:hypothetical protein